MTNQLRRLVSDPAQGHYTNREDKLTPGACLSICFSIASAGMQLFALYNHTEELNHSARFYSLRVPLQVWKEAGLITEVHTHWLDYMTQHFTSGAQLVDGFFHLGDYKGMFPGVSSESLSPSWFQNSLMHSVNHDGLMLLFLFNFIFCLECDKRQLKLTGEAGTASLSVHLCSAAPSWIIYA